MKIISIRLEQPLQLGTINSRNLPQKDYWADDYEGLEPSLRDRAARLTIDADLKMLVIRRGTEERRIPLHKIEWINTVPDADDIADPLSVPSKVVASKLALTEEEEAALVTTPAAAPRRAGRFVKK